MKDYVSMSDFEINCEVLAVFNPDIKHMSLSGDNSCFYDCGPTGDGWNQIDIPDYCNNPVDAWPIIVENRIRVNPVLYTKWMAEDYLEDISHSGENPLRCAMVVFLMMEESE